MVETNSQAAIKLDNLTKTYGEVIANKDLSFSVREGEIFGYLGPNGAGKTTTIRQLLGLIKPSSGTAEVLGADIRDRKALTEVKKEIGYLPDELGFDGKMTGDEVLDYFARMRGDSRREELLELFHPPLDQNVETYSSGNKRMLGIVQAFMHDPKLVIMDEPTSGLDPLKQDRLHKFVENEKKEGKTIFFSSHFLSEVQRVCDRVGIIRAGKLVDLEQIDRLLARSGKKVRVHFEKPVDKNDFLNESMIDTEVVDNSYHFTYTGDSSKLIKHLSEYEIKDIEIGDPQLDEIFKHYYGE
ncbi:ABC transporter ATP-binding protein [Methanonatronarchaeum sp. AMET6-2]|uniref:ABC transporter ATP-binding protein n=1 Tax=Methanonatronarchaeum sp. AMET6-2 TaxID=2933293 RepID=UPI001208541F|nr:ABC transporter ATP-binding protein [Methanonatronarchaeum sp. AMET6-2]RZN63378.1 MAG: ABC transporter ATP-binding protein [Methanonatronarchaeia archaeon]UOY10560.1 ABC transporter ATP-binding protein [Methanonatronarchaeum sp. AMET6-2]